MSIEQTVLQFYQRFDANQLEALREIVSSDFAAHLKGLPKTLSFEEFLQFGKVLRKAFPDGKHTFDQVIVNGNEVVTQGKFSGTHQGDLFGIAPTGKRITIAVQHLDRVEHNQIIEHRGKGDQFGLIRQIGIVPILSGLARTALGLRSSS
jgi:predicted ester cyclase